MLYIRTYRLLEPIICLHTAWLRIGWNRSKNKGAHGPNEGWSPGGNIVAIYKKVWYGNMQFLQYVQHNRVRIIRPHTGNDVLYIEQVTVQYNH